MEQQRMIQLCDIEARYKKNHEPKEIAKARKLISSAFKDLEFIEDVHKYYVPSENGKKELPSVSAVCHQFEPYVDWEEKCAAKAMKMGISADELAKQWHEKNITATTCGTKTHYFGENIMNMFIGKEKLAKKQMPFQYTEDGYMIPYCPKEWAITQYYLDILDNKDVYPVMPETRIYTGLKHKNATNPTNFKQDYAGTFDILLAYMYKGEIVYAIHDFKTNADIYKNYSRDKDIMMEEPFGSMGFYSEPYSIYSIQLSLYQLGLMQLGLKIVDRCLIWLKDDGTYEKIKTPDLTEYLKPIL